MNSFKEGQYSYIGAMPLYPLIIALAFFASIATFAFFWKREKFNWSDFWIIISITVLYGIIGGRLWYIFNELISNRSNPFPNSEWYAFWDGHISFWGAFIFSFAFDIMYIRYRKNYLSMNKIIGMGIPSLLIGMSIGQWVNFANHVNFGFVTSLNSISWLGHFISQNMFISTGTNDAILRTPLFFYSFLTYLVAYLVIVGYLQLFGKNKPGIDANITLIFMNVINIIMMSIMNKINILYLVTSALLIILSIGYLIYLLFNKKIEYQIIKIKNVNFYYPITNKDNTIWLNENTIKW